MDIALDATGITVRKYTARWITTDYNQRRRDFVKLHAAVEPQSQAFVAWHYTPSNVHEARVAPTLLQQVTGRIHRVLADSAYLSNQICIHVHQRGATPYLRPKKNTKGRQTKTPTKDRKRPHPTYLQMLDDYQADPQTWLKTHHQRSRIESAFSALKQTLGTTLQAMTHPLQKIKLTLRLLVWNLTRRARRHF